MRTCLAVGLLFFTVSCGGYQFPAGSQSPTPAAAAVSGRVLAVPCAPVERANSPCTGRPVSGLELDYLRAGNVAGKAVTDSGGGYSVDLAPGTYAVKMKGYMRVLSGPLTLSVAAGSNTVANYTVESGIRVPAPAQ